MLKIKVGNEDGNSGLRTNINGIERWSVAEIYSFLHWCLFSFSYKKILAVRYACMSVFQPVKCK